MVEASGTMDKVMTGRTEGWELSKGRTNRFFFLGCFAHYATLHHADPSFKRYLNAHKWFSAFDLFSSTMRLEQEYATLQYMPYMVVPMHTIFVDSGNGKVGNPRADWEVSILSN